MYDIERKINNEFDNIERFLGTAHIVFSIICLFVIIFVLIFNLNFSEKDFIYFYMLFAVSRLFGMILLFVAKNKIRGIFWEEEKKKYNITEEE